MKIANEKKNEVKHTQPIINQFYGNLIFSTKKKRFTPQTKMTKKNQIEQKK